ncbi:MAG: Flp family type IVb pilin [Candidatus Aquicultor secundus]|uniref:Flp family type IVb pilin n=1 Tax=Candidatus Aquicultor secundus TaxID=1973895 RepID=A0A2M7T832_9ACTN|nr:Flp family type IVb pilin [Candidatus Aquicultor secundus]NCO65680.1 Flp family type IVb pilin [Solirubrobacter sp.]OIO85969.1 MAG: pilus assembly protein [Candidatus Aquicultor secundus]PIU27478.1 MAG: Flp family type IVb pilin [Candidatus Aquicultor secundus]PIW22201.1 MAG: Flp family type IVb pilin [Candidatus Aquicultor secundus]PIX52751.1 MAG: Flp family type IVb pilin [Candidatus Aquicultor secundus]
MLAWFYGKLASYLREEDGATAVEYGIMVALIAAVIIGTVVTLGGKILTAFQTVVSNLG